MLFYALIISVSITSIIILLINLVETDRHTSFVKKRMLQTLTTQENMAQVNNLQSPLTEILTKKVDRLTKHFIPERVIEDITSKIRTSNINNMNVSTYFLTKSVIILCTLIILPLGMTAMGISINSGLIILLTILGFMLPDMQIKSVIEKRHKAIMKELSNYIDLLRVCIEAGLDLESGLNKLAEKSKGILKEETQHTTAEIRMGKSLVESLQDMTERINLPDLTSFITLLIQANQMGISISNIMKTQAEQMTIKYVQEQRAKAAKVPVLIIAPMVFFIMPALLVVILGPVVLNLMSAL